MPGIKAQGLVVAGQRRLIAFQRRKGKTSGKDWTHVYREIDIADLGEFLDGAEEIRVVAAHFSFVHHASEAAGATDLVTGEIGFQGNGAIITYECRCVPPELILGVPLHQMSCRAERIRIERFGREFQCTLGLVRLKSDDTEKGQRLNMPRLPIQHLLVEHARLLQPRLLMQHDCLTKGGIGRRIDRRCHV